MFPDLTYKPYGGDEWQDNTLEYLVDDDDHHDDHDDHDNYGDVDDVDDEDDDSDEDGMQWPENPPIHLAG